MASGSDKEAGGWIDDPAHWQSMLSWGAVLAGSPGTLQDMRRLTAV
jgi:hypothetical protein